MGYIYLIKVGYLGYIPQWGIKMGYWNKPNNTRHTKKRTIRGSYNIIFKWVYKVWCDVNNVFENINFNLIYYNNYRVKYHLFLNRFLRGGYLVYEGKLLYKYLVQTQIGANMRVIYLIKYLVHPSCTRMS